MKVDGVSIMARGITATGPLGPVFENVDADIRPGDLATVTGPSGTGRTSLLLALSGRLRFSAGYLEVSGHRLPKEGKDVRRMVVPARLRPGFELEPRFLVREAVRERRITTGIHVEDVEDAFALVGIDPEPDAMVGELHPGEQCLLAVALAAASGPAGMLVDDVDLGLPQAARTRVWAALEAVTRVGTTVLAVSPDPPRFDDHTRMIRLASPGDDDPVTRPTQPMGGTSVQPTGRTTPATLTMSAPGDVEAGRADVEAGRADDETPETGTDEQFPEGHSPESEDGR